MKTEIVEKYRDEEKRQVELQLVISGTSEKEENGRVCLQSHGMQTLLYVQKFV